MTSKPIKPRRPQVVYIHPKELDAIKDYGFVGASHKAIVPADEPFLLVHLSPESVAALKKKFTEAYFDNKNYGSPFDAAFAAISIKAVKGKKDK